MSLIPAAKRRRRVLAAVAALLVASPGAVVASSVATASAETTDGEYTVQDSAEAVEQDISLIALGRGVSQEEARDRYASGQTLGDVATHAASEWPDQFVGSSVSPSDGGGPTVYIKGLPDPRLLVVAVEAGVRVVGDQPYSFNELEDRKIVVHRALEALGYKFATTSFDIVDGRWIDAHVAGTPHLTESEILAGIPEELRRDVRLTMSDEASGWQDLQAFGGMRLRANGSPVCTSGWSVRNVSTGETGVTGAGHCNGVDEIRHPGHGLHALSYRRQHRGEWGDIEWYAGSVFEPDDFYADAATIRDVAGVEPRSSISVGESVCFYGRSSNDRDCSLQVYRPSVACTISGVYNDRLVMMDGRGVAAGGDSGGGFSFGEIAYGSVKGFCDPTGWLTFSVADLYDEALNVRVRLS